LFRIFWESEGGAGCSRELRTESGKYLSSQCFSAKFLTLVRSSPFGFTLVELLVVIAIIGVLIAQSRRVLVANRNLTKFIPLLVGKLSFLNFTD
jgi:prepilin-type N-terminal cleavage/methylation domain-containing protein